MYAVIDDVMAIAGSIVTSEILLIPVDFKWYIIYNLKLNHVFFPLLLEGGVASWGPLCGLVCLAGSRLCGADRWGGLAPKAGASPWAISQWGLALSSP